MRKDKTCCREWNRDKGKQRIPHAVKLPAPPYLTKGRVDGYIMLLNQGNGYVEHSTAIPRCQGRGENGQIQQPRTKRQMDKCAAGLPLMTGRRSNSPLETGS